MVVKFPYKYYNTNVKQQIIGDSEGDVTMEQKYQIGTISGKKIWDVEKIQKDISQYVIKEYNTFQLLEENPFYGNEQYAMSTDISIPLIVVELKKGKEKLIDGNHRLFKANKSGHKTIAAHYLSEEEHKKYIVEYDEKLYEKIVEEF